MNMHVRPVDSGNEEPRLFEAGDIVRIGKSEAIGRVIEDQGDPYKVRNFGEPNSLWDEENSNATFTPSCLEIWKPTNARPVVVPALQVPPGFTLFDFGELHDQTFKILQAFELIGSLVETAKEKEAAAANHSHEEFLNNVQFLASTFADMACHVLDSLPAALK